MKAPELNETKFDCWKQRAYCWNCRADSEELKAEHGGTTKSTHTNFFKIGAVQLWLFFICMYVYLKLVLSAWKINVSPVLYYVVWDTTGLYNQEDLGGFH